MERCALFIMSYEIVIQKKPRIWEQQVLGTEIEIPNAEQLFAILKKNY